MAAKIDGQVKAGGGGGGFRGGDFRRREVDSDLLTLGAASRAPTFRALHAESIPQNGKIFEIF